MHLAISTTALLLSLATSLPVDTFTTTPIEPKDAAGTAAAQPLHAPTGAGQHARLTNPPIAMRTVSSETLSEDEKAGIISPEAFAEDKEARIISPEALAEAEQARTNQRAALREQQMYEFDLSELSRMIQHLPDHAYDDDQFSISLSSLGSPPSSVGYLSDGDRLYSEVGPGDDDAVMSGLFEHEGRVDGARPYTGDQTMLQMLLADSDEEDSLQDTDGLPPASPTAVMDIDIVA